MIDLRAVQLSRTVGPPLETDSCLHSYWETWVHVEEQTSLLSLEKYRLLCGIYAAHRSMRLAALTMKPQ